MDQSSIVPGMIQTQSLMPVAIQQKVSALTFMKRQAFD
jgi:hypothetical protein